MPSFEILIDITDHVPGLHGPLLMSVWIFVPHDPIKGSVFCVPEDAKASYHLVVPGFPEETYSFALIMAARGWLVIAVDPLGTGESTRPTQDITIEMLACANDAALQQVMARLVEGSLDRCLPKLALPSLTICVGHGKGAILALTQQVHYRRFDALAVLGWSNYHHSLGGCETALASAMEMEGTSIEQGMKEISRVVSHALRPFLYSVDVPFSVIRADEVHVLDSIRSLTSVYDYALIQQIAALIDVPLFLCLADQDVADNLQAEAATYPWSPEVTTFLLHGSAHRSHVANTRDVLWMRLEQWFLQMLDWNTRRKEGF
jgi:pimeloyl-ACP methyl ester carboxylesterase